MSPDLNVSWLDLFHSEDSRSEISELFDAGFRGAIRIVLKFYSSEKKCCPIPAICMSFDLRMKFRYGI